MKPTRKPAITLQRERELGRTAEPCECGLSYCNGWTFGGLMGHGVGQPIGILKHSGLKFGTNHRFRDCDELR